MNGFLPVLKPPGMTSQDVVAFVKRRVHCKAGHAGTLDPEAAGVLPVMVGKATRLFDAVADKEKTYVTELCIGSETDTQDSHGTVTARSDVPVTREDIMRAIPSFLGTVMQTPPMYSALKRNGVRPGQTGTERGA